MEGRSSWPLFNQVTHLVHSEVKLLLITNQTDKIATILKNQTMDIDTIDSKIRYQPRVCRLCLALTTTYFSLVEDTRTAGMLEALTSLRVRISPQLTHLQPSIVDFTF